MLDINLLRVEKGGNPELVKESQRRRFADVALVDKVSLPLCLIPALCLLPDPVICQFSAAAYRWH